MGYFGVFSMEEMGMGTLIKITWRTYDFPDSGVTCLNFARVVCAFLGQMPGFFCWNIYGSRRNSWDLGRKVGDFIDLFISSLPGLWPTT